MSEIEVIQHDELQRARLKLSRRLAAAIMTGLAKTGEPIERIEARLEKRKGYVWRVLVRLSNGKHQDLEDVAQIFWAMGLRVDLQLVRPDA